MERRSPGVQVNQTIIEEAIDQVLAGNREAYRTIIQAYERKIYTYCYYILRSHEEAEDAVQDIFVKVYQNSDVMRNESLLVHGCIKWPIIIVWIRFANASEETVCCRYIKSSSPKPIIILTMRSHCRSYLWMT